MTPHTEAITNSICTRFRVDSGLSIEQLDAEIESLGFQAAQIELWNADPSTPPWMRRIDAERVAKLRDKQAELLGELVAKKLRARDSVIENLPRVNVKPGMFPSYSAAALVFLKWGIVVAVAAAVVFLAVQR